MLGDEHRAGTRPDTLPAPRTVTRTVTRQRGPSKAQQAFLRGLTTLTQWVAREGAHRPVPRTHGEPIAVEGEVEPVTVKLGVWVSNTKPDTMNSTSSSGTHCASLEWNGRDRSLRQICIRGPGRDARGLPRALGRRTGRNTGRNAGTRPTVAGSGRSGMQRGGVLQCPCHTAERARCSRRSARPTDGASGDMAASPRRVAGSSRSGVPCREPHIPCGLRRPYRHGLSERRPPKSTALGRFMLQAAVAGARPPCPFTGASGLFVRNGIGLGDRFRPLGAESKIHGV